MSEVLEFKRIEVFEFIHFKCVGCGRNRRKVISDWGTVRPDKTETEDEIRAAVKESVKLKVSEFNKLCKSCEKNKGFS